MDEFFKQRGSQQSLIRANISVLPEFIGELERSGNVSDNRAFGFTREMLFVEQELRPTASSLVASIVHAGKAGDGPSFCGICCASEDEDFSDWTDTEDFM